MNKAARVWFAEKGKVELQEFEPKEPGDGEVLIKSDFTLISPGTELAFLHGLPNTVFPFPSSMGYSNVGVISKLGKGVEGLPEGDRVAAAAHHASMVIVPVSRLIKIPPGIGSEEAVYFHVASFALAAVRKSEVQIGETVIVLGQGIIGNLSLQFSKIGGACPVIGIDAIDRRLEIARACGAELTLNPGAGDLRRRLREAVGRDTADVVIDATGIAEAIHPCLDLAGFRARLILLGSSRGETEKVNFYRDVHKKGVTIIGAHADARPKVESSRSYWTLADDWRTILRLMVAGRLAVRPLTTDLIPFRRAPEAYDLLLREKAKHLGVLLDWRGRE